MAVLVLVVMGVPVVVVVVFVECLTDSAMQHYMLADRSLFVVFV